MSTLTAINPWYRSDSPYSRKQFNYDGRSLLNHRGIYVFHNPAGSYDYVLAGITIAQRAGFQKEPAIVIINEMMDGITPHSKPVADHITANGGNGYTYEQYMQDWAAGKVS